MNNHGFFVLCLLLSLCSLGCMIPFIIFLSDAAGDDYELDRELEVEFDIHRHPHKEGQPQIGGLHCV